MTAQFRLDGSVALVTGGGSGLGAAQCRALSKAGATVVVADLNLTSARRTCESLPGPGRATQLDVADVGAFDALVAGIDEEWGALDVLVNNAGISVRDFAIDARPDDFDAVVAVNMRAVYFGCQAAAKVMRPRGKGRVINIASIGGYVVDGERSSLYDATKAAVVMMTKSFAYEWAKYGIRVNAIAPGYIHTPLTDEFVRDSSSSASIIDRHIPAGRIGTPDDLAGPVTFLASEASAYVTGHTLVVDGGWLTN